MNARFFITLAAVVAFTFCAEAKRISSTQALARLNNSNAKAFVANSRASEYVYSGTETDKDGNANVYYFKDNKGGLVITTADDSKDAVIGYTDNASGEMPAALKAMLEFFSKETTAGTATSESRGNSFEMRRNIEPMVKSVWGQSYPFNRYTPVLNGQSTPCGCVSLALATCMRHNNWPEVGEGKVNYYATTSSPRIKTTISFDTVPFAWNEMADNYSLSHTPAQAEAAAKALYAIGAACKTTYAVGGSSTTFGNAAVALCKYFKYATTVNYIERDYFTYDQWESKIYFELKEGRPVPYSGSSTVEGHAFVIDGYRQGGYFHVLWGWGGQYDGWFKLTSLDPRNVDLKAKSTPYDSSQGMIVGMYRNTDDVSGSLHLRISGNFYATQTSAMRTPGKIVEFRGENGIFSMSYATKYATLGVRLVDQEGNETYIQSSTGQNFKQYDTVTSFSISQDEFPQEGLYEVYPVFLDEDGVWDEIYTPLNKVNSIYLSATPDQLQFTSSENLAKLEAQAPSVESSLRMGEPYSLSVNITNSGKEFMEKLYPVLLRNGVVMGVGTGVTVNIPKGEDETITFEGTISVAAGAEFEAGTYNVAIAKKAQTNYEVVSPVTPFYVGESSSEPALAYSSLIDIDGTDGAYSSLYNPIMVYGSQVELKFDIECYQGYFGQNVGVYIYYADNASNPIATIGKKFVSLEEGESKTIKITANVENLEPGQTYLIEPWSSENGRLSDEPTYFRIGMAGMEMTVSDEVVAQEIYNFAGQYVGSSQQGLAPGSYIIKEKLSSGKDRVIKVMIR